MLKIPTYKAVLVDESDGITAISWVKNPATCVDMICFSEDESDKYTFSDDEKMLVTSVVMLADTKIYRRNGDFEYYITYDKDTLVQMCEKMLKEDTFKNISFEHNGVIIDPSLITLVELYTVDDNKKSPFNIPSGSIVATYHINDNDLWQLFKSGELSGISLEGYFNIEQINFTKNDTMKDKIVKFLKELLSEESEIAPEAIETTEIEKPETFSEDNVEEIVDETVQEEVEEEFESEEESSETSTESTETTPDDSSEENPVETTDNVEKDVETLKAEVEALNSTITNLNNSIEEIKNTITQIIAAPSDKHIEEVYETPTIADDKWAKLGAALQ